MANRKMQAGKTPLLLTFGIVLLIIVGYSLYMRGVQKGKENVYTSPTLTNTPAITQSISPTPILTSGQSNQEPPWQPYNRGEIIPNADFSINYPEGWKVNIRKNNKLLFANIIDLGLEFDLLPPDKQIHPNAVDFMGWGVMYINVNKPFSSIEDWFTDMLSKPVNGMNLTFNTRAYFKYTTLQIGNKTGYFVQSSDSAPEIFKAAYPPGYIVLTASHSYGIGFGNGGELESHDRTVTEIFPTLTFN